MQDDTTISLSKDDIIDLSKNAPNLKNVRVCLGWDETKDARGEAYDLDAIAFVCKVDAAGKPTLISNGYFVYFKHLASGDGAVVHQGDNLTGAGKAGADKEQILVALDRVTQEAGEISFFVNIYDAAKKAQQFGAVRNAFIRLIDDETGCEIARYNLTDDFSGATIVQFGSLFRTDSGWDFKAIGAGFSRELVDVLRAYGAHI
jgi:tellurium resistance protein TerD